MADPVSPVSSTPYRVLARKYRPGEFSQLIGQDAMVRTLSNAFRSGRLAHAFMLTGVRGVGKTTTARIIARALNCVGPDGAGGPTIEPCGVCEPCRAIAEDRHVDVLEMDAASRTGIDDIREIIESVRYRPATARFKVYIIDEVHMLSRNAFNGLLKTLEEPPAHVTFIFATTEVRKVPITVLSRCQRFDLRRVDAEMLARHFTSIAAQEAIEVEPAAICLIARAADGSVRDGLSLLDQAIAHAGTGIVAAEPVRAMLGLADREATLDILEAVMAGDAARALDRLGEQYTVGADPQVIVQDLLRLVHWLTRLKVIPAAAQAPEVSEADRVRGLALADALAMPVLTRTWQMLLKGLAEVQAAEAPLGAAEMVLIRLAYVAHLPTPDEAIRALADHGPANGPAPSRAASSSPAPADPTPSGPAPSGAASFMASPNGGGTASAAGSLSGPASGPARARAQRRPETGVQSLAVQPAAPVKPDPTSFASVAQLAAELKEGELYALLVNNVHVVRFEPGRIDFRPGDRAPSDLANRLSRFLNETTARRWVVAVANADGERTLAQTRADQRARRKEDVAGHPLVRAVFAAFPGAAIEDVRETAAGRQAPVAPPAADDGDTGVGPVYDEPIPDGGDPGDFDAVSDPPDDWTGPGSETRVDP